MDLRNLKFFSAIADSGGVSSAARQLNTVQSNVTARLKDLEKELGVELFYRTGKGMVLTSAGEILRGYAWRLDRLSDEARQAMRDCAGEGGLLRIGAMETTTAIRLPAILKRLQGHQPKLEVRVTAGPTETLLYELLAYRLDGAFVAGEQTHKELTGEPIFKERLVLVRPADKELSSGASDPEQLIVFRRGCSYRLRSEEWLKEQGQLPFRVMEFGTLDGILGCVAAGLGVSLLPEAVIAGSRFAGDLKTERLPKHLAELPTYFVRRKDASPKRSLDAFLKAARESGKSPVPKRAVG